MVGPKKQDFCPKINILIKETIIFWEYGERQFLGMILENKVVQKLKLEKNVFKKWSPKLIFLNDFFFFEKIPLICDIENWLWKYDFGIFRQTGAPRILKIQRFPLSMACSWQKAYILGPTIFKIPQPNWH